MGRQVLYLLYRSEKAIDLIGVFADLPTAMYRMDQANYNGKTEWTTTNGRDFTGENTYQKQPDGEEFQRTVYIYADWLWD